MHLADGTISNQICRIAALARDAFALTMTAHAPFAAWETVITAGFVAVVLHARSAAGVAAGGAGRN